LQYCIYYINTWYAIATELTYASTQFCKQCNRLNSLGYLVELICYAIFPQKKKNWLAMLSVEHIINLVLYVLQMESLEKLTALFDTEDTSIRGREAHEA
jgi:hypothetical protein